MLSRASRGVTASAAAESPVVLDGTRQLLESTSVVTRVLSTRAAVRCDGPTALVCCTGGPGTECSRVDAAKANLRLRATRPLQARRRAPDRRRVCLSQREGPSTGSIPARATALTLDRVGMIGSTRCGCCTTDRTAFWQVKSSCLPQINATTKIMLKKSVRMHELCLNTRYSRRASFADTALASILFAVMLCEP